MSAQEVLLRVNWSQVGAGAALAAASVSVLSFGLALIDRWRTRPRVEVQDVAVSFSTHFGERCSGLQLRYALLNLSAADDVLLEVYAKVGDQRFTCFSWASSQIPPCILAPNLPYSNESGLSPNLEVSAGDSVKGQVIFEVKRAGRIEREFEAICNASL